MSSLRELTLAEKLDLLTSDISTTLVEKERTYQGSWKKRGGVGAFMMLARKWDRLENICEDYGYDVFAALGKIEGVSETNKILGAADLTRDQVVDLIAYLLLVLSETDRFPALPGMAEVLLVGEEPGPKYVDPD